MTKEQIIKQLRDMAKHPTVTLPRDCEALKAAADLLSQQSNEQVEPIKFPRNAQEYAEDWIIDPAFISRVKHSIDPETPWDFTPTMEQVEATLLALEVIPSTLFAHPPVPTAQPKQEPNKDGSPCPEFWDWLQKAYNFEGNGNFTKYNMEVAFLAGKQAAQPEQKQNLKLMPRKATPEMLKAMDECSTEGYDERLYEGHAGSVYMAAWDAFYGQHCYCGDITNLGVIHRDDGPCHYPSHIEPVVAAARVLNKRMADTCQVDEEDSWKVYGDAYIEDARAALKAAHGITGEKE